jgi:hypothetical protein
LGLPLQESQELLARIYRFPDLHSLQQDLAQAKKNPAAYPCGPYDDEVNAAFFSLPGQEVDPRAKSVSGVERNNRLLHLVAEHGGRSLKSMPLRFWDVREIGLFARPDQHRVLFKQIKAKYEILTSSGRRAITKLPSDYAHKSEALGEHNATFEFTALGRAVKDALEQIELSFTERNELDPVEFEEKLDVLAKQHPSNPWVFASSFFILHNPTGKAIGKPMSAITSGLFGRSPP